MGEEIVDDKEVDDGGKVSRDWTREKTMETRKTMETWRNKMGDE